MPSGVPHQKSEDVEIIKTGVKLPQGWPRTGIIKFDNVVMKYAPHLPPALRGVSFSIKSGEKVRLCTNREKDRSVSQ